VTARVIFLNHLYWPDEDEIDRLDWLQEQLEIYQAELAYMTRDMNDFQRKIAREASHHKTRAAWMLIKTEAPF
jgi:hypothetical protein